MIARIKSVIKQIIKHLKPKAEDFTYEDFMRIERKKFRGPAIEERAREIYFRRRDW